MACIAFYAPLKSPHHPVPSGERQMARNLMRALSMPGQDVALVSEFRSLDKTGDAARQTALIDAAKAEAARLIGQGGWSAWITYHSYYKAPDLVGPTVCDALNIPYLAIEATRAAKRLNGPWDFFERHAAAACDRADMLFHLTQRDADGLGPHLRAGQRLVHLAPFLAAETLPDLPPVPKAPIILLAGMMRPGDKLASYEIAAQTLAALDGDWQVEIAGDGPARAQVEALMAPFGDRVTFLGQLDTDAMQAAYARARAFFWPGVNEAFGMVYLEAQAMGVPVVAEDREGVRDVTDPAGLSPQGDIPALAHALDGLLNAPELRADRSARARALVADRHLLGAARDTLWGALTPLLPEVS